MQSKSGWFYASFHALQVAIFTVPVAMHFTGIQVPSTLPPLGNSTVMFVAIAFSLCGIAGYWPFHLGYSKWTKPLSFFSLTISLCSFVAYVGASWNYTETLNVPQNGVFYQLSIGTKLNPNIDPGLDGKTSHQKIDIVGWSEEGVRYIWTENSIRHVRMLLGSLYLLCQMAIQFTIGAMAVNIEHRSQRAISSVG